jgi:hypothetical protein
MIEQAPSPAPATQARGTLRVVAFAAVGLGLAALAGAAFVLSYAGIHAVALQAGVSHRLAKGYPLILDVLLVVVVAAVLALRGAGWPSKLLAWASLLALLAAAAGADALHAAGKRLPAHPAAVTAAILPWALVLIAFMLLLAMLRHARLRRLALPGPKPAKWQPLEPPPLSTQPLVPGFPVVTAPEQAPSLVLPRQVTPEAAADKEPAADKTVADKAAGRPVEAELAPEDPAVPAASAVPAPANGPDTDTDFHTLDLAAPSDPEIETDTEEPAADDPADVDSEMPVFHRMWSAPVPPTARADV